MFTGVYACQLGSGMGEGFHRHCLECVVGGNVLKDLGRGKGCFVLISQLRVHNDETSAADLIIAEQPESRCLIVLVVADQAIVCSDL